ncbi:MAG: metal ABC transporter permease, partial [Chlamydiia bacterium]|nr:metal ABC transporter permease [Chlamydiia bacterium]
VLSVAFGIGIMLASVAQHSQAMLYRQIQAYLYGQVATMTDVHIYLYGGLVSVVALFLFLFHKEVLSLTFDVQFSKISGLNRGFIEVGMYTLILLSLIVGIRCVGVILMSAMLIAPAAAARQFTNRLSMMYLLAALFGSVSAFLGLYGSILLSPKSQGGALPSGPMIVLVGGSIALLALLFAPRRGLLGRYIRIARFKTVCIEENLLKTLWRLSQESTVLSFQKILKRIGSSSLSLHGWLYRLIQQGALVKGEGGYILTEQGRKRGARIVRLHRLWEVYLVHLLGVRAERVHKSAEEMEHILTPELEERLAELLDHPTRDPHLQPIPNVEGRLADVS